MNKQAKQDYYILMDVQEWCRRTPTNKSKDEPY